MLFVFAEEFKDHANRLFLALKNGIGPFRGVEQWFRFSLATDRVLRVKSFSVSGLPTKDAANRYGEAIEEFLESGERVELAFVLHPKTDTEEAHSPYYYSKFPLLSANIPTQSVTTELLDTKDLFQWSAGNIALQAFAKMGGTPWAIATGMSEDSLIVGINRATVIDRNTGEVARWWGFATVFSHDGVYQGTTLFPPADTRAGYLATLKEAVTEGLASWRQHVGTPTNLVIHIKKGIGKDEVEVVEQCLRNSDTSVVRAYSIVRLSDRTGMLLFDPTDRDGRIPPSGVAMMLTPHRAILQVAGRDPSGRSVGRVIASEPLQVRREYATDDAPGFPSLCTQVVALSSMNWRGLNAEASPVSIQYPRRVADILAHFDQAGFDLRKLRDVPSLSRAWFL